MRTDENERFYGERIGVKDILAGKARHPPYEIRRLMETLKAAQGDTDVDESLIPDEAPPADFEITAPEEKIFGVPDAVDPDPYGVLALQEAGMEIREAGTNSRPTSEQFEFKPSITSPVYSTFRNSTFRRSMDTSSMAGSRRSSWRTSTMSSVLEPRTPTMVDSCTQTDMGTQTQDDLPPLPSARRAAPALPPRQNVARTPTPPLADIPETRVEEATLQAEVAPHPVDEPNAKPVEKEIEPAKVAKAESVSSKADDDEDDSDSDLSNESEDEDIEIIDEPIIHEVHQAAAPQVITRARVVQVAKPVPPQLPMRNPFRNRMSTHSNASLDAAADPSPTVAKHSPDSTPSLMRGDSTSSLSSMEDNRIEQIGNKLKPKFSNEAAEEKEKPQEKEDAFHSLPESPMRSVPGGFN